MEQSGAAVEQSGSNIVKLSVFMPRSISQWVGVEAAKLGIPKSTFVRLLIYQAKGDVNHAD